MRKRRGPDLAEQYFKANGGYRLTGISAVGLALLVIGNQVAIGSPWLGLVLIVPGLISAMYAGVEAWSAAMGAPRTERIAAERAEIQVASAQLVETAPRRKRSATRSALRSLLPFGGVRAARADMVDQQGPTLTNEQNGLFMKVAVGSWLFAGVGGLFFLSAVFRAI